MVELVFLIEQVLILKNSLKRVSRSVSNVARNIFSFGRDKLARLWLASVCTLDEVFMSKV